NGAKAAGVSGSTFSFIVLSLCRFAKNAKAADPAIWNGIYPQMRYRAELGDDRRIKFVDMVGLHFLFRQNGLPEHRTCAQRLILFTIHIGGLNGNPVGI